MVHYHYKPNTYVNDTNVRVFSYFFCTAHAKIEHKQSNKRWQKETNLWQPILNWCFGCCTLNSWLFSLFDWCGNAFLQFRWIEFRLFVHLEYGALVIWNFWQIFVFFRFDNFFDGFFDLFFFRFLFWFHHFLQFWQFFGFLNLLKFLHSGTHSGGYSSNGCAELFVFKSFCRYESCISIEFKFRLVEKMRVYKKRLFHFFCCWFATLIRAHRHKSNI